MRIQVNLHEPSVSAKHCPVCKCYLAICDFNKRAASKDGRQNVCRSCQVKQNKASVRKNKDARRAVCRRRYDREKAAGGRTTKKSAPIKARAHRLVYQAIRKGLLTRPEACPVCGSSDSPIHGHHSDYLLPLDVVWLCAPCHGDLHAQLEGSA